MGAGDIIRDDDLSDAAATAQIPLAVSGTATAGDTIDIFATVTDPATSQSTTVTIGNTVQVVSGSGGNIVILVPRADEVAWVVVSASGDKLQVVQASTKPSGPQAPALSLPAAISQLCASAHSNCSSTGTAGP